MSKRKLLKLVNEKHVNGWDDPRMPTLSGVRRRGYPAAAIREFAAHIGVARRENLIDIGLLEHYVREDLNKNSSRYMAVLKPLKVVIINYPEGQVEIMHSEINPEDHSKGTREIPFSREIYVEQEDFMEVPEKKYFRLFPGSFVRLKSAYIIECVDFVKDENGEVTELHCKYYPESKSGSDTSGIKAKGVLHWVSCAYAVKAEGRLYDRLFTVEQPDGDSEKDFQSFLNPDSLVVLPEMLIEPAALNIPVGETIQFLRHGYFCVDKDSSLNKVVFNRTVTLKDSFKK